MPTTALIVVDVQADLLPGGALPIAHSDEIIAPIVQLAEHCDLVVATRDWHPKSARAFLRDHDTRLVPHCVQDTKGARIHPKIRKLTKTIISKGMDPEQDAYSAFQGKTLRPVRTLEQILDEADPDRVIVTGLALDRCVRWTALDSNALGHPTVVSLDCTRPFTIEGRRQALVAFNTAGVEHWQTWRDLV